MPPTHFLGIVPPAALAEQVLAYQRALDHHITAPHVTLLAPSEVAEDRWSRAAQQVAGQTAPVHVQLGGVGFFEARVVFLQVHSPGLEPLHRALVAALGEPPGEFALEHYHPHLTLALAWRSMNAPWTAAVDRAQTTFDALLQRPLDFMAQELVLFAKAEPGTPYHEQARFALSGRA